MINFYKTNFGTTTLQNNPKLADIHEHVVVNQLSIFLIVYDKREKGSGSAAGL